VVGGKRDCRGVTVRIRVKGRVWARVRVRKD